MRAIPWLGWTLLAGLAGSPLAACHLVAGIEEAAPISEDELCDVDADCDDTNPCSEDRCDGGLCVHDPLDGPLAVQTPGDCAAEVCTAGTLETVADDADLPDDGEECTTDSCAGGTPQIEPVAGGTACATGVCNGEGACRECFANAQCTMPDTCGGDGTPWTCGCTPIPCSQVNLTCGFAPDDGCGGTLDCNNGAADGGETDVDCGGPPATCATRCNAGKMCSMPTDCASGVCSNGVCT